MERILRGSFICILVFLLSGFTKAKCQQSFDKSAYYKLMEKATTEDIDKQLKIIESSAGINNDAYTGALLMKKAGVVKGPSKKLSVFKSGNKKLEAAIEKDNQNAEWRFLRLIIQENAPKILGYRSDIKKDAAFIQSNFKKLSPEVQAAVLDYRKHSDTLRPLNF